jgi:hypothetical protein
MKMPAPKYLAMQDAYPMQAEGGFVGDLHASVHKALVAWEKKRELNKGFRYGHVSSLYRREKAATATRAEISWNASPEVKRAPCPRKKQERTERAKEANRLKMAARRERETPEQREKRLEERRAWYASLRGDKYKAGRNKRTPEQRKQSIKDAKKRYMARKKAGAIIKTYAAPSKFTAEQLAAKAERQRRYHAEFTAQLKAIKPS